MSPTSSNVPREYLTCKVGEHEYLIDVTCVDSVLTYAKYLQQVQAKPLLELRKKGLSCGAKHDGPAVVIILHDGDGLAGLLVHQVNDILEITPAQVLPLAENPPADPAVLRGQVLLDDRKLWVLDTSELLDMRCSAKVQHSAKVSADGSVESNHLPLLSELPDSLQ